MPTPLAQSSFQVRFDWGRDGLRRVGAADVVVVVDVIGFDDSGAALAAEAAALPHAPLVLGGSLRTASATAARIMAEQHARGERTSVAVVGAGAGDPLRFAVEDQLGAGAVISALSDLGIDHSSPEAVVAGEAFRALRRASRHLLTASASGLELEGTPRHAEVAAAARIDADAEALVLSPAGSLRGGSAG